MQYKASPRFKLHLIAEVSKVDYSSKATSKGSNFRDFLFVKNTVLAIKLTVLLVARKSRTLQLIAFDE